VSLEVNAFLCDRYRIKAKLAQSGMGAVYLAHDETLSIDIAIKENLYTTQDHSRQFRREATILAKVRHPNLPRVIDHFIIAGEGEYLVMDYVPGQDLCQRMESLGRPMTEEEAVSIGSVVCEALAYLHSQTPPIIHRDIKPANLKISPDGHLVLVDFGLAKLLARGEMTTAGAKGITAGYSPIEQYGEGTDARSDIYALGATLYTLLTNQIPPQALDRALGQDNLKPINTFNPDVSEELGVVIGKAMAVRAEDRFQSVLEFQEALLAAHPLPENLPNGSLMMPVDEKTKPPQNHQPALKRKKRSVWIWLAPLLLLAAGAAVVLLLRLGRSPDENIAIEPSQTVTTAIDPTLTLTPLPTRTEAVVGLVPSPTSTLTPEPQGTPSGGGSGQIAFVSESSGMPQIYLMNLDGSELQPLTHAPDGACQPEWSPDGSSLAYISPCSGWQERYDGASIYVLNLATGRSDLISTFAAGDYDPAWSPDGKRLAFASLQTGKPQIFIYEFAGGTAHRLMNRTTINRMPAWSPDGAQIAFVSPSPVTNQPILYVVDADGLGDPRIILGQSYSEAHRPVWSPDGDLILFDLGLEGTLGGRQLSAGRDVDFSSVLTAAHNPAFSPDGHWVVCEGGGGAAGWDIFVMLRTGEALTALTDDAADEYQAAWRP
jgi:serine/threonine protein kinase